MSYVAGLISVGRETITSAWSSAPRHLGSRDRYIGWSVEARRRNICLIAYNTRFLILPSVRIEIWHRTSRPHGGADLQDRQQMYGHPIYFLETFQTPAMQNRKLARSAQAVGRRPTRTTSRRVA